MFDISITAPQMDWALIGFRDMAPQLELWGIANPGITIRLARWKDRSSSAV